MSFDTASLKFTITIDPDKDTVLAGGFTEEVLVEVMAKATAIIPGLTLDALVLLAEDMTAGGSACGVEAEDVLEHKPSKTRVTVLVAGHA